MDEELSLRHRVLYYTLGLTPPVRHRAWVERDINSRGFLVRHYAQVFFGLVLGAAILVLVVDLHWSKVIWVTIGGAIGGLLQVTVLRSYIRNRSLAYYDKRWKRQLSISTNQ